jgi:thiamine-monophosphate kinase
MSGTDEFAWIERLRSLTGGDVGAYGLLDDAAVVRGRPGQELVVSKDAMVEGVHVLAGEARDVIARRLLRTNLSDLAAKGARPFGYFLLTAWPESHTAEDKEAFARGLEADNRVFRLALLGGDTVSTPGPLTVSATVLGWTPEGRTVRRGGAEPGDVLMVTGVIGDGYLGLKAARGEIDDPEGVLAQRYQLPEPRVPIREALLKHAAAAADVSDGLLADALHLAEASGCEVRIEVEKTPLSPQARAWAERNGGLTSATMLELAAGGDDYEVVCAVKPHRVRWFSAACARAGVPVTAIGRFAEGDGIRLTYDGYNIATGRLGWRHGTGDARLP